MSDNLDEILEIIEKLESELKGLKLDNVRLSGYGEYMLKEGQKEELTSEELFEEEREEEFVEEEKTDEFPVGSEVILEDGRSGIIIKKMPGGQFLVEVQTPEKKVMVFSSKQLKRVAQYKPGDVVRRTGEAEEYTVLEVDEATGKVKVKSKTTGTESYVDVGYLEKVSQRQPYLKPKVEIKDEVEIEEEVSDEKEVPEKEERVEVKEEEVPVEIEEEKIEEEVKGREREVLLTETIKSVFTDPEIAIQIVEKLLDLVMSKGLEVEFAKRLSSVGLSIDDLGCPFCYADNGEKVADVFIKVLGSKIVSEIAERYKRG